MNAPPPVSVVLLDFYGTLAAATEWAPRLGDVLRAHGAEATTNATTLTGLDPVDGIDHAEHSADRDAYTAWERARLAAVCDRFGIDAARRQAVVDELHAAIKTYTLELYDDVAPALAALRSRGLRLAICSNWDWDLPELVERLGLADAVDVTVTSARAGARKPHERIYAHTLELLGVSGKEAAFVGDSWEPDVVGPLAAGMRPFHLLRDPEGGAPPALPRGASRIATLTELLDHL